MGQGETVISQYGRGPVLLWLSHLQGVERAQRCDEQNVLPKSAGASPWVNNAKGQSEHQYVTEEDGFDVVSHRLMPFAMR
jgi:hypothetical protein